MSSDRKIPSQGMEEKEGEQSGKSGNKKNEKPATKKKNAFPSPASNHFLGFTTAIKKIWSRSPAESTPRSPAESTLDKGLKNLTNNNINISDNIRSIMEKNPNDAYEISESVVNLKKAGILDSTSLLLPQDSNSGIIGLICLNLLELKKENLLNDDLLRLLTKNLKNIIQISRLILWDAEPQAVIGILLKIDNEYNKYDKNKIIDEDSLNNLRIARKSISTTMFSNKEDKEDKMEPNVPPDQASGIGKKSDKK